MKCEKLEQKTKKRNVVQKQKKIEINSRAWSTISAVNVCLLIYIARKKLNLQFGLLFSIQSDKRMDVYCQYRDPGFQYKRSGGCIIVLSATSNLVLVV